MPISIFQYHYIFSYNGEKDFVIVNFPLSFIFSVLCSHQLFAGIMNHWFIYANVNMLNITKISFKCWEWHILQFRTKLFSKWKYQPGENFVVVAKWMYLVERGALVDYIQTQAHSAGEVLHWSYSHWGVDLTAVLEDT